MIMNIVSTMVGLSVAASALPMVTTMSLAPIETAKRSSNFTIAEAGAVTMLAQAQENGAVTTVPDGCSIDSQANGVYQFICTAGQGDYEQTVARTWVAPDTSSGGSGGTGNASTFAYETPVKFSPHQCPTYDEWGVYGYNEDMAGVLGGACIPRDAWNRNKYMASNPTDWLYDITNWNGWGTPEPK